MTRGVPVIAAVVAWTVLLGACAASSTLSERRSCGSDLDCGEGQLCFAEGCGDPGRGIVIEVSGSAQSSQFARDFPIEAGTLGATKDLELGEPLTVSGQFIRRLSDLSGAQYLDPVTLRAVGESQVLPGVTRTLVQRFDKTERGFFEMRLAAGTFTLTATPSDRTVPPVSASVSVGLDAGSQASVSFSFVVNEGLSAFAGQLVKTRDERLVPPEPVLVGSSFARRGQPVPEIELQIVDGVTGAPLSQRQPVSTTTGEFAISISPEVLRHDTITIIAAPREEGVPVPIKRFEVPTPISGAVVLEYGDYGEAGEVGGLILDETGAPVAGAQVKVEGVVAGDGTFRSRLVTTDVTGRFRLEALSSRAENSFELVVVPPRSSRAGALKRRVTVRVEDGVATLIPAEIIAPSRVRAHGTVTRPNSDLPMPGVVVRATIDRNDGMANLIEPAQTVTDEQGRYELALEPGVWRFELEPGDGLPITSRQLTVEPGVDGAGNLVEEIELRTLPLFAGRTVSGVVTSGPANAAQPLGYAQLRFFRVTTVDGRPASILLGAAVADGRGRYDVVLPTISEP